MAKSQVCSNDESWIKLESFKLIGCCGTLLMGSNKKSLDPFAQIKL